VQDEIRKSMNSARSFGSIPSQSTVPHFSFFLKWPLLGSAAMAAIILSQSSRTGVTSIASISSKSVV